MEIVFSIFLIMSIMLNGELFKYIVFVLVAIVLLGIYFYIKTEQEIKTKKLQEFKEWQEAVNNLNESKFEKYAEIIKYNFDLDNSIFKDKMDYINLLVQKREHAKRGLENERQT